MPSALAVFKLITVSNLVGCNTGRSAGFAPSAKISACAQSTMSFGFAGVWFRSLPALSQDVPEHERGEDD
jgi:hypothetical protein